MIIKICDLCGATKEKNNCRGDSRFNTKERSFLIPDPYRKGYYVEITRDICTTCETKIDIKIGELAMKIKGGLFDI